MECRCNKEGHVRVRVEVLGWARSLKFSVKLLLLD